MSIIVRRNGSPQTFVPFYQPFNFLDEVDALTGEMWDSSKPFTSFDSVLPQTDVYEEKGKLVVKTELPGIAKEDLDITLDGDRLIIEAEKKEESYEDATHHTRERYYGKYYRSLTLPYAVKEDKISAIMEDGVLEIKLPKTEETKARKIEIKAQLPKGKRKVNKSK